MREKPTEIARNVEKKNSPSFVTRILVGMRSFDGDSKSTFLREVEQDNSSHLLPKLPPYQTTAPAPRSRSASVVQFFKRDFGFDESHQLSFCCILYLGDKLFPADAVKHIPETLAGFCIVFKKFQRRVNDFVKFFLIEDNRQKIFPDGDAVAVKSAERNYKTGIALPRVSRTTFYAFSAIKAVAFIEGDRSRCFVDRDDFLRADSFA